MSWRRLVTVLAGLGLALLCVVLGDAASFAQSSPSGVSPTALLSAPGTTARWPSLSTRGELSGSASSTGPASELRSASSTSTPTGGTTRFDVRLVAFSSVDCAADPSNADCAYGTPRTVSPEQYGGVLFILGAMLLVQVATFIVTMTKPNLAANRD